MKNVASVLLSVGLIAPGGEVLGCSPPRPFSVEFDETSVQLDEGMLRPLKPLVESLRVGNPKCSAFRVQAFAADKSEPAMRLAAARATQVQLYLISAGAVASHTDVSTNVGTTPRRVYVASRGPPGVFLCDPESRNSKYDGANCEPEYTRCIWRLKDGTICNWGDDPNPNPSLYSVKP